MNSSRANGIAKTGVWRFPAILSAFVMACGLSASGEQVWGIAEEPAAAEVKPADKDAKANEAARRDAEALGWILQRGLRRVIQVPIEIAPPHNGPPDANIQPQLKQQIDQQAQQLERMFDPVLASELEMIRQACGGLEPAARKAILAAGRVAVKKAALGMAERQMTGRFGQDEFDPRLEIRRILVSEVEKVGPEPLAAYQREQAARAARQAHAARLRIVATVDSQLDLSAVQREAIEGDLKRNWNASWVRVLADSGLINDQPLAPDFAGKAIEPHLAAAQKTAWKTWCQTAGTELVGRRFISWHFDGQGLQGTDPWWEK